MDYSMNSRFLAMSDPYLFAIGLLPLSVSLPELPELWQPDFWISPLSPHRDRRLPPQPNIATSTTTEIVPDTGNFPEFFPLDVRKTLKLPRSPEPSPVPKSGAQLYQQRLTALKAGQLYTRLRPGRFVELWRKAIAPPSHQQWKILLAAESQAIAGGQGTNHLHILLGDSLSLWFPSHLLPKHSFWLNQGISGETSGQIRDRLHFFTRTRPSKIYIMAGTNDLLQGKRDTIILNNLQAIVRGLKQNHPQGEIIVQSILPTRTPALTNERIRRLNQNLATIVRREGGTFLDIHAFFSDEAGNLRSELTTDGIHLSDRGYEVWRSLLD
jgi:lysophospholipase L1-like esterase